MTKFYFIMLLFLCFAGVNAQELLRPIDLVNHAAEKSQPLKVSLFETVEKKSPELSSVLDDYMEVKYNPRVKEQMERSNAKLFEIDVPISSNEKITLQLVEVDIYDGNRQVQTFPSNKMIDVEVGTHYRGIIKGKPESIVAISLFKDEVIGLASGIYGSNLVIGRLEGKSNHVVYIDQQIAKHQKFECAVPDDNVAYTEEELGIVTDTENRAGENCVRFYIEVNYDIYLNKGSESAVSNFATGVLNQVMTLYANDNINTKLMPLGIWTQSSPYTANSTSDLMRQFQNYRTNWDGDLAQLIGFSGGGGLAAGFSGICNTDRRQSMSYSGINGSYNIVPTYSWTVQVITHEYGHIMGSRHTHACVWNGNGTAIDGCAGYVEGNCSLPGYPAEGGTIMSYCHQRSVGMNLSRGFGTQPGNVLRNRVAYGSCLNSCDGVDPGPNPTCNENEIVVSLTTDRYPQETSWVIYDEDNNVVADGDGYVAANTNYETEVCLEDGCYRFEILDSYGDGMCCSYGQGNYSITVNGEEVGNGGDFDASEATEFCAGNPAPTCIDTSIVFETDNYASEISFNLKNANGEIVASGNNLTSNNFVYTIDQCIAPGCYTLTFNDSYGDGFCCSYGNGYYRFLEGNNIILSAWADFDRSVSTTVCIGNNSSSFETVVINEEIPPFTTEFNVISPFDETLVIKFGKTKELLNIENLTVYDMNGRPVYTQDNVSTNKVVSIKSNSWTSGIYFVKMNNNGQQTSVKVIKK